MNVLYGYEYVDEEYVDEEYVDEEEEKFEEEHDDDDFIDDENMEEWANEFGAEYAVTDAEDIEYSDDDAIVYLGEDIDEEDETADSDISSNYSIELTKRKSSSEIPVEAKKARTVEFQPILPKSEWTYNSNNTKVKCDICLNWFIVKGYPRHYETHDPNRKKWSCVFPAGDVICPAEFTRSESLRNHILEKHRHEIDLPDSYWKLSMPRMLPHLLTAIAAAKDADRPLDLETGPSRLPPQGNVGREFQLVLSNIQLLPTTARIALRNVFTALSDMCATPAPKAPNPRGADSDQQPTGKQPVPTGMQPKQTGKPPVPTGMQPKQTGKPPVPTGMQPKQTGKPPVPTGIQPKQTGKPAAQERPIQLRGPTGMIKVQKQTGKPAAQERPIQMPGPSGTMKQPKKTGLQIVRRKMLVAKPPKQTGVQTMRRKKPVAQKPVAQKPVAQKPVAQKPVVQKPVAQKPVAQKPGAQNPANATPPSNANMKHTVRCDECGELFPAARDLIQHSLQLHPSGKIAAAIVCKHCGNCYFKNKAEHEYSCTVQRCMNCGQQFPSLEMLRKHIDTATCYINMNNIKV